MATAQFNCRIEEQLAARVKQAATDRQQTIGTLVAQALELLLAAPSSQVPEQLALASTEIANQLAALAKRLEALEADRPPAKPASPKQVTAAPPERLVAATHAGDAELPERRLTAAEAAGLLTTPEVGTALGLGSHSALTNWIAREAKKNGSAVGSIYHGHRLRGKGLLPGGQKPGWLWEPAG
jgi:hypothetical protein